MEGLLDEMRPNSGLGNLGEFMGSERGNTINRHRAWWWRGKERRMEVRDGKGELSKTLSERRLGVSLWS